MKYYIAMFRKDDMIDLYKFGQLYVYNHIVEYSGDLDRLEADTEFAEKKFFAKCNPMDYSIEYYIVVLECASKPGLVKINQVRRIYSLDMDSYKLGLDLNTGLVISRHIWQKEYLKLQVQRYENGAIDGAKVLNGVFGYTGCDRLLKLSRKNNNFLFEALYDNYIAAKPDKQHSIWYYLLRYERHQNYPADNRGFFLDMLHVYGNFKTNEFKDVDFKQHPTGKSIVGAPANAKFPDLWRLMEKEGSKTILALKKDKLMPFLKVAPFFFLLKKTFENGLSDKSVYLGKYTLQEFVRLTKEAYHDSEKELEMAVQLTGYALGRDYTYKYSYTHNPSMTIIQKE